MKKLLYSTSIFVFFLLGGNSCNPGGGSTSIKDAAENENTENADRSGIAGNGTHAGILLDNPRHIYNNNRLTLIGINLEVPCNINTDNCELGHRPVWLTASPSALSKKLKINIGCRYIYHITNFQISTIYKMDNPELYRHCIPSLTRLAKVPEDSASLPVLQGEYVSTVASFDWKGNTFEDYFYYNYENIDDQPGSITVRKFYFTINKDDPIYEIPGFAPKNGIFKRSPRKQTLVLPIPPEDILRLDMDRLVQGAPYSITYKVDKLFRFTEIVKIEEFSDQCGISCP